MRRVQGCAVIDMGLGVQKISTHAALPLLLLLLVSCGGGGGGSSPPVNLSYPQPSAFVINQAITPLMPAVMGHVTSYAVSPALPTGLALNSDTGVISGTPTAIAAKASYTVRAENLGGSTSAILSITVNDVAPLIAYSSAYYGYTADVTAKTFTPTLAGGAVVTWSVNPALPPGLALSAVDGSVSGMPTAAAAPATYTIIAANSGGQSIATLTIAVAAAPFLDLGPVSLITLIRYANSSVLSQDDNNDNHRWLLQNFASGPTLASGDGTGAILANGSSWYVDLENDVMIDQTAAGLEVRSATDGHVRATIPAPAKVSWYRLATDGSYVTAGSPTTLTAWSTSGQVILSKPGDYSKAVPFAAPGQILIGLGPAGQNVIEGVSVTTGNSSVTAAFQGVFNSWFIDGQRFLTTLGSTVRTYSNSAVQQDVTSVTTVVGLTGQGNWLWTMDADGNLNVYQVGASGAPAMTIAFGVDMKAVPSGTTIGVIAPSGGGQLTVIDLSGGAPVSASYTVPYIFLSAYAALSATQWLVGNIEGVVFDGASLSGQPRSLTLGRIRDIAGGTDFVSVATASGKILYFNASDNTLVGTISFSSEQLAASSDGAVLAASAAGYPSPLAPDQTLNIYSLPSGTLINTFPYSYPQTGSYSMTMSGSGTIVAQVFDPPTPACSAQVIRISDGAPILCDTTMTIKSMALSPDGTLAAASPVISSSMTTSIYKNGILVATVPGGVAGWLDNTRLVVTKYTDVVGDPLLGPIAAGTTIYDSLGKILGTLPISELPFSQVITANSVYLPESNTIMSLTTGGVSWATGNPSDYGGIGAISGSQVVFWSGSGNLVLAQPF